MQSVGAWACSSRQRSGSSPGAAAARQAPTWALPSATTGSSTLPPPRRVSVTRCKRQQSRNNRGERHSPSLLHSSPHRHFTTAAHQLLPSSTPPKPTCRNSDSRCSPHTSSCTLDYCVLPNSGNDYHAPPAGTATRAARAACGATRRTSTPRSLHVHASVSGRAQGRLCFGLVVFSIPRSVQDRAGETAVRGACR